MSLEAMLLRAVIWPWKPEGQAALPEFVEKALDWQRDMLIMSVGGLLGRETWFRQASEKGCRIYVPSGAIAGLDESSPGG